MQNLHNAQGQRVIKTVSSDINTAVHFIYNQAGQVIAEIDATTGTTLREYVYVNGQQMAIVDDTGSANEATYFVHNDHLGTPQKITDVAQAVVWDATYKPFGEVEVTVAHIENNIRFPGQYADEETGLHYNYFRDYDPSLGRYVESDPIGLRGGMNTFEYVSSNPTMYFDSFGLIKWRGKVQIFDAGFLFAGAAIVTAELTSDCVNNERYKVFVSAKMLGINIGILPAGYGESTETLVDDLDFIDPYVLEGFSGIGAMGGQVGGIGLALTDLKLGGARTPNYREPNVGPTKGLGEGLLAMLGRSKLDAAPIKMDCGCN